MLSLRYTFETLNTTNQKSEIRPEDLAALNADDIDALISYLNLPPVGGYRDQGLVPDPSLDDAFEIEPELRQIIASRRDEIGKFKSGEDLLGIDGFDSNALTEITGRLSNLNRYGNKFRPVWGGPESKKAFFELLESAKRYIHISTYILGGKTGLDVVRLLKRKMQEGVQVRLLFCASGLVVAGSPSGTGFVSPFSELRSYSINDMYTRKPIVKELRESKVPFVNSSPIGRHWKRSSMRKQGIKSEKDYYRHFREISVPDEWLIEQEAIDRECGLAFANVDHRKMVIVDGERSFVGGQNIADSYFYSNELAEDPKVNIRNWQWHDNSAILEGGAVAELNALFARRWILSGGDYFDHNDKFYSPPKKRAGNAVVTIESSIPGMLQVPLNKNFGGLLVSLLGADRRPTSYGSNPIRNKMRALPSLVKNDFYVEHCYPSDSELLHNWMGYSSIIGDFTMVVPLHYDTNVLGGECDRFYPEIIDAGVKLFGYDRAIMHSKIAMVDEWYTALGSYNLTLRSGRADLELQFFVQCPEFGSLIKERIQGDLKECKPVKPGLLARFRSKHSIPIYDAVARYFFF